MNGNCPLRAARWSHVKGHDLSDILMQVATAKRDSRGKTEGELSISTCQPLGIADSVS
jgi:hypothetical protein